MQEELHDVPLFPLNVILFPGMALPLHIFEQRYRQMTRECLDTGTLIGIVLALPESTFGHELPARVGTFARICDYERLPDGCYNILVLGTERFEIVETHDDRPYLTGTVRLLEDAPTTDTSRLEKLDSQARIMLQEYLELVIEQLGGGEFTLDFPEPSEELSFLLAASLSCDDQEKQRLLEMTSVAERLAAGLSLLHAELMTLLRSDSPDTFPSPDDDRTHLN